MTPWTRRLIVVVVLASLAGHARAEDDELEGVVADRTRAQARFEVSRAKIEELARQREEAAEMAYLAREQEFLAGRGTLQGLLEGRRLLAVARSPLPKAVSTPRPALEDLWL
jgi:hypothetical protein